MATDAHPTFEVATVKLSDPAAQKRGIDSKGHSVVLLGQTLTSMMVFAYQLHKEQIVGGPEWISTDKYDVEGVPDAEGAPDLSQIQEMVRKLLHERFGLVSHHDRRDLRYYGLTVATGGPKLLKTAASDDNMPHESLSGNSTQTRAVFRNSQMSDFALDLQLIADRPVTDETGIKGRFDFALTWQSSESQGDDDAHGPPGLYTAMKEQLGLQLSPRKGLMDVEVIEKVTRPSAN